jgi:general secretion pathway protein A
VSYYKVFGLEEEPFSTSPDPAFFYESAEHREALLRLEIAVKLKRGASLVLGDIGTGKTTLARRLFMTFQDRSKYEFSMLLDPAAESEQDFLFALVDVFGVKPEVMSVYGCRKAIEAHLFQKGVTEGKTVILLVDEAQKLNPTAIEVLRTLLNFETNKFKLLQLILFAQTELLPQVREIANFWDRLSLKYVLNPLSLKETKEIIEFRLRQAGYRKPKALFSDGAVDMVFHHTEGCPRRIMMLCHNALENLIVKNRPFVDSETVRELISEEARIVDARP